MAQQTVTADLCAGASATKTRKGSDIFRLMLGNSRFLDINPVIYKSITDGNIDSVEYDDSGEGVTMEDGTVVNFFRVNKTHASGIARLRKAGELIEAAKGFDEKAYAEAQKKLEGLVL